MHPSFEGPDWGFKSTGAQRAACLRAMGKAIEDDKDVSKMLNTTRFVAHVTTEPYHNGILKNCGAVGQLLVKMNHIKAAPCSRAVPTVHRWGHVLDQAATAAVRM